MEMDAAVNALLRRIMFVLMVVQTHQVYAAIMAPSASQLQQESKIRPVTLSL